MQGLLKTLLCALPKSQAAQELRWIKQELPADQWQKAVIDRSHLKPLQYILGTQPFGPLTIRCKENVLIPRNDTEEWCIQLLNSLRGRRLNNILDYCTGTGCIALTLASSASSPKWGNIVGTDINRDAILLANENAVLNKARLMSIPSFEVCDLRKEEIPKKTGSIAFDLLVSNPPYIPVENMNTTAGVEKSVLHYEPWSALVGNLEFYESLCKIIPAIHAESFIFELGYRQQALAVRKNLPDSWFCGVKHDSSGRIRNVVGWRHPRFQYLSELIDERLS
ncbi:hypothetical protein FOA43_004025 [Brettanomyces nanus]|uniref:peptide chain release factor N(5)-glutamine methyltransferase n=1 Tax=Eeniella nana TaxID=13502 RepID=A0A875S6S0_EENNA|nr:uncharacterized protein FOA43_004025 [Brettanomyces nanus]QPG76633.1 hypothetical protein FOA43_004025 [Brettanomyces nanus]